MSGFPRPSVSLPIGLSDVTSLNTVLSGKANGNQSAVADLNLGTLTLLTDVITAVGTMQSRFNALLTQLRAGGMIAS